MGSILGRRTVWGGGGQDWPAEGKREQGRGWGSFAARGLRPRRSLALSAGGPAVRMEERDQGLAGCLSGGSPARVE